MRSLLAALILFSFTAVSEDKLATTFETNYLLLQKKIDSLKQQGKKIDEDTRKELDAMMVKMNHEHTELKRELEKRNQQVNQKVDTVKETTADWSQRVKSAYHELSEGAEKAWSKIKKGQD